MKPISFRFSGSACLRYLPVKLTGRGLRTLFYYIFYLLSKRHPGFWMPFSFLNYDSSPHGIWMPFFL